MMTPADSVDPESIWKSEIDSLLTTYAQKAPLAALRLARSRLNNRWLNVESERRFYAHATTQWEACARWGRLALLGSALALVAAPIFEAEALWFLIPVGISCALWRIAVSKRLRLHEEADIRTQIVPLKVAVPLLDMAKASSRARDYLCAVMKLYNEYRGLDYVIAKALAETETNVQVRSSTAEEHDAALWELFEVESFGEQCERNCDESDSSSTAIPDLSQARAVA